jgi:hypothetical protein
MGHEGDERIKKGRRRYANLFALPLRLNVLYMYALIFIRNDREKLCRRARGGGSRRSWRRYGAPRPVSSVRHVGGGGGGGAFGEKKQRRGRGDDYHKHRESRKKERKLNGRRLLD